jgi:hypothetical protein
VGDDAAADFAYAGGVRLYLVAWLACGLVAPGWAQTRRELQKLLPAGAAAVETARLNLKSGQPRVLVLWMSSRTRVARAGEFSYCGDYVYGDHWSGPARLSLVDSRKKSLINTIEINSDRHAPDNSGGIFRIPYFVSSVYYRVPRRNRKKEGVPRILHLRDMTGEGQRAQFVLFDYLACGIANTSVFGYSLKADRAVQFEVETFAKRHRPELTAWVPQVFLAKPVRPGAWRFTWEAGHGDMFFNHEDVSFDRERQLFVRKLDREAYPGYGEASCELSIQRFAKFLELLKAQAGSGVSDKAIQDVKRSAETIRPGDDDQLYTPISVSYRGREIELDVTLSKYQDGVLGVWIVTEQELAALLQRLMDQALR